MFIYLYISLLMKNIKAYLLMLFGLLTGLYGNAKTEDVIVSDYKVDFETPIVTNTGKYGDADRDFIVSTGWGHLVGMLETGYNNTPTYVPYIYNKTNGVGNSGCLEAGAALFYDSWESDYLEIWDYLVTPLVKGTVTVKMKKSKYGGKIEFYTMRKNGDKWERSLAIAATSLATPNTDDFVEYILPELADYTYIGIRMSDCYIDDFTASSANFKKTESLKVNDIIPDTDQSVDENADGKFTVTFKTTVTNNGDFDLTSATENYSVSLYKVNNDGGADKADHQLVATVPVGEDLAINGTSGELTLTGTLNMADCPEAAAGGIKFRIYEDVTDTYKETKNVTVVPYAPVIELLTKVDNATKKYNDGDKMYLGASRTALTQEMIIVDKGASPLEIQSVTVPEGFTSTLAAQTVAPHDTLRFCIATTETAGTREGDFVIKSNAGETTLRLKAVIAGADEYFVDFETKESTIGMIAEKFKEDYSEYGWITDNQNDAGYPGNKKNAYMKTDYSEKSHGPFKMITPQLDFGAGNTFSFDAARYYSSEGEIKVYYSPDRIDWQLVRTLSTASGTPAEDLLSDADAPKYGKEFLRYTITNIPAGQYYVAIEGGNNKPVYVDNIIGPKKVEKEHDIFVNAKIPENGFVNSSMNISVNTRNMLPKEEKGEGYVVKVLFGDNVVKEIAGQTLAPGEAADLSIDVTPHAAGTFEAMVKLVFNDGYEVSSAKSGVNINEEVFESIVEAGGPAAGSSNTAPIGLYFNKSEAQSIYSKSDLNGIEAGQKIASITYRGNNTSTRDNIFDMKVWLGETEMTEFATPITPIDNTTLTEVFNGSVELRHTSGANAHDNLVTLNLPVPYEYKGGNLVVNVRTSSSSYNMSFGVDYSECGMTLKTIRRGADTGDLDAAEWKPASTATYNEQPVILPVIYLGMQAEAPGVSGVVTDKETKQPISGASVSATCGGVVYSTSTDSEGKYSMKIMKPELDYVLKAFASGYNPAMENINVSGGSVSGKNLELEAAKGLFIESADIPQTGVVNYAYRASAKVTNYTTEDIAGDSYTAKLYVGNEVVAEADAVEVAKGKGADFTFSFTPHAEGTFPAYIEFVKDGYRSATATADIVINAEADGGIVQICDSTKNSTDLPVNMYFNNSTSVIVYTPDMLKKYGVPVGGVISKVKYNMWATSPKPGLSFTLNAWVGTVEGGPSSVMAMSASAKAEAKESMNHAVVDKVYENFAPEGVTTDNPKLTEIELDFGDKPIVFDGINGVRIIFEKSSDNWTGGSTFALDANYNTAYNGQKDNTPPEDIDATKMNNTPVAFFTVAVGCNVTGTVADAQTSQPVKGASVRMKSGDVLYETTTGDDGKYEVNVKQTQLEDYVLEVEATEDYEVRTVQVGKVEDGMVKDVALRKSATVSGKVASARDDSAIDGAEVTLKDADGNIVKTAATDASGHYSLKVRRLDADYKLVATADGFVDGEAELNAVSADVEQNFSLETISKRIYGVVRDMDTSEPIEGATVSYSRGTGTEVTVHSDAEGKYEMMVEASEEQATVSARKTGYVGDALHIMSLTEDMKIDFNLEKDETVAVGGIHADELAGKKVYDLNGRLVSTDGDTGKLKRGQIYVVDGRKVILK